MKHTWEMDIQKYIGLSLMDGKCSKQFTLQ